jgi:hypothetical protein
MTNDSMKKLVWSIVSETVEQEPDLTCIPLNFEDRTGHLPHGGRGSPRGFAA